MSRSRFVLTYIFVLLWIMCLVKSSVTQQSLPTVSLSAEEITQLQTQAETSNVEAQFRLGAAYEDGNGVRQSDKEAVRWYRAAAEGGNAKAQNSLGLMFRSGRGVEQDKVEAIKWYRKAARQKNPTGTFNLGTAYYNGDGIAIDDVAAYAWFFLAQDFGSRPAAEAVKRVNEEPRNFEAEAFEKIGDMYQKGDELPQSFDDAIRWYRKASQKGGSPVQIKLANLLLKEKDVTSQYAEVRSLCEKAANLQSSSGNYCLGLLYEQGWGVEKNPAQAVQWFNKAANLGDVLALLKLGQMYWDGEGVKQDKISAYEFICLASTSDLTEAKIKRANLEKELSPKEIKKAKAKAIEWAQNHHPLLLRGKPPIVN